MHAKLLAFNTAQRTKDVPEIRSGDVVRVYRKIVEGDKERVQLFEGMVIAMRGGQSSSQTITVRKVSYGVGVEIVVPVHAPFVDKIEVIKRAKVRRAKLYYIRHKAAKALRFKFKDMAAFAQAEPVEPEQTKEETANTTEESVDAQKDAPAEQSQAAAEAETSDTEQAAKK